MPLWQRPGWIRWGRSTSEQQGMLDVEIKPYRPYWDGLNMSTGRTVNIWVEESWDWSWQTAGLQGDQSHQRLLFLNTYIGTISHNVQSISSSTRHFCHFIIRTCNRSVGPKLLCMPECIHTMHIMHYVSTIQHPVWSYREADWSVWCLDGVRLDSSYGNCHNFF